MASLATEWRTRTCGDLRAVDVGTEVKLAGWVSTSRDHGGVIFIDLRDRYGTIQVVFGDGTPEEALKEAEELRSEFVISVEGAVRAREQENVNPKMATGEIEILAEKVEVLSASLTPPLEVDDAVQTNEEHRLRYRFVDLRRPAMREALMLRHRLTSAIRRHLDGEGFADIETPILTRSTPEGARDYLVPSRLQPGHFYALPQSPQLFKQLLMIAGFDRYYQIARCFRDEDSRADRQPEFTQLDIEMAFIGEEDIIGVAERVTQYAIREATGVEVGIPFPRIGYAEAVSRFGKDAPDVRFAMEIVEVTDLVAEVEFKVFASVAASGGCIRGIRVPGGSALSLKDIENLTESAKVFGAKGLAWFRCGADGLSSTIAKFFTDSQLAAISDRLAATDGDILLFVADRPSVAAAALGAIRLELAERFDPPEEGLHFTWVCDFPLFEHDDETGELAPMHHPFTSPHPDDIDLMTTEPERVRARAYDLVLNGNEVAGGSIRINDLAVQQKVFAGLGIGDEEAQEKFGFLLDALKYGAPPHGGIAFGFDRLAMILAGRDTIRDVIAFPKTQRAVSPLTGAPSEVDPQQLKELGIQV